MARKVRVPYMNIRDLVGRLGLCKPADLLAHRLIRQVIALTQAEEMTLASLNEIQPQIDEAINELEAHRLASKRIIQACWNLQPTPSKETPIGL